MQPATFTQPANDRYFEDYAPGAVYEFGSVIVTESEIIEFAERFDPQTFHIDPELAERSIYGGIIASGWHTGSIMMRLLVDNFLSTAASMGSPGVDELRWSKPVHPGDELSIRVSVVERRLSKSKPDRGIVKSRTEVLNQNRDVVMEMTSTNFFGCRAAGKQQ